ncbi:hypothetical protein F4782DRAFT_550085 [Xylaria castorea]|nr:hypothetical protein F4782DRAFT_550085 [Xylaria castorea]
MRGLYMCAGVFALAGTSHALLRRWTYPDCEADNCYRAFINEQYTELAPSFCLEFLASTTTDAAVIPTPFENCAGDIHAVSSACSCVTYTHTRTKTTSTPEATPTSSTPIITPTQSSYSSSTPSTTLTQVVSSTEVLSTTKVPPKTELPSTTQLPSTTVSLSTSCPGSSSSLTTPASNPNSSAPSAASTYPTETQPTKNRSGGDYWSLSTVYSTTVCTMTSCAPTVPNCPATSSTYLTTSTIPVIVTVYPAHPTSYPVWTPGGALNTSNTLATSRGPKGPTATFSLSGGYSPVPTAAAARARFNDVAIAVGGAIAIAFL